jgi:hypothetical protein
MLSSQNSIFFIICLDSVCCDGDITVENPPAEATPDFAYKPCKGSEEEVIGEPQKEEETGLALYTFPAPCSCVCSRGPRNPIVPGANAVQSKSVGHELTDVKSKPPMV